MSFRGTEVCEGITDLTPATKPGAALPARADYSLRGKCQPQKQFKQGPAKMWKSAPGYGTVREQSSSSHPYPKLQKLPSAMFHRAAQVLHIAQFGKALILDLP